MSDITMTNKIMHIHLSSWRYFTALTLPPLVLIFNLLFSLDCVLLMGLFLLTHYYCWRIWLDERLFQLIESDSDLAEFDNRMAHLWAKKTGNTRTLAERWRGARNLFLPGHVLANGAVGRLTVHSPLPVFYVGGLTSL